jgi:hypothetical protein
VGDATPASRIRAELEYNDDWRLQQNTPALGIPRDRPPRIYILVDDQQELLEGVFAKFVRQCDLTGVT